MPPVSGSWEGTGTRQRHSGQMLGSFLISNIRKILTPHFGGSSLHPTNRKRWKFLENKFPRVKMVIAPAQGKCCRNPILMNLKECQNFCVNGRVMSMETVPNMHAGLA